MIFLYIPRGRFFKLMCQEEVWQVPLPFAVIDLEGEIAAVKEGRDHSHWASHSRQEGHSW